MTTFGPIRGHFENQTFVCDRTIGEIAYYDTGFTGLFWHIVGKFIRKYESVGVDVVDTRLNRRYHLYVTPGKAEVLARAVALIVPSSLPTAPQTAKVRNLKLRQAEQVKIFEAYARNHQWDKFHTDHYDWWCFPVNRPSRGYGDQYYFSEAELASLRDDADFMESYRRGVQLVVLSYGWDMSTGSSVDILEKGQGWRHYGVRLGKIATSLQLLREEDFFRKLQQFAIQKVDRTKVEGWVMESLQLG
jgi:hypothetical protein